MKRPPTSPATWFLVLPHTGRAARQLPAALFPNKKIKYSTTDLTIDLYFLFRFFFTSCLFCFFFIHSFIFRVNIFIRIFPHFDIGFNGFSPFWFYLAVFYFITADEPIKFIKKFT